MDQEMLPSIGFPFNRDADLVENGGKSDRMYRKAYWNTKVAPASFWPIEIPNTEKSFPSKKVQFSPQPGSEAAAPW
jgi:hypothetical protein